MEWAQKEAGGEELERSGVSLHSAREEYYRQMDPWDPEASRWESELCTMSAGTPGDRKFLKLEFGPSSLPFDFDDKKKPDGVVTITNEDVKLHVTKDFKGVTHFGIYVKCKIPGTSPRQGNITPLAGVLTDTLTEGASQTTHLTHLLHSTRVMVDSLGCENNPSIPSHPPA